MEDILILGAGNVGKTVAYDLFEEYRITMADADGEALEKIEKDHRFPVQDAMKMDAGKHGELKELIAKYDIVVGALPGDLGYQSVKAAAEAGTDMIDVSFMPEDPFSLDGLIKENAVSVVVDAGFGPGLSNVFMGRIQDEMDVIEDAVVRIGGLPLEPRPPLHHKVTFSPRDLIQEYVRDARVIRDDEVVKEEPMKDIGEVELNGKEFEEFYSDGLRTLLKTVDAKNMEETTLRWKGHLEKMKVLKDLGFFEEENLDNTLEVIGPLMSYESEDFCIMKIEAIGKKDEEERKMNYFFYDEASKRFSSMARSTGCSAAVFTRLLMEEKEDIENGVIAPEVLGMEKSYHDFIVKNLRDRGIKIEISRD
ncbi:MAG: saccharopine dehydrogenase C-terminal domain-containing protein [Candidatus Thermoplasmatota archaeon]